ncbi:unnamed protein product [Microthlaspi erraticum]|uniref:Uncharacterized protein n=1 Tax=Microthlaspi erraticum TaxID=1685480 RepID=A0A6D2K7J1_9BRAS|nr:unnamed protein product [Microthlaspi erraticum]
MFECARQWLRDVIPPAVLYSVRSFPSFLLPWICRQKLCFEVACEVGWTSDVPFVRWSSVVAWFVDIGRESGCLLEHSGAYGTQGAWRDLAHGSSSTGYAKEDGRSHLEDQLDRPTRPAKLQLDRAGESKSNPKNVASPLTSL